MRHLVMLPCLLVLVGGCADSQRSPLDPSTQPSGAAAVEAPTVREILVGEDVGGSLQLTATQDVYEFTAPTTGTLVARLTWPVAKGRLELWLAEELAQQTEQSPIVSTLSVVGGRKYRVRVVDYPWIVNDASVPYVLTTSMK